MANDWQSKAWGRTRCVESNSFYQRHELQVLAGGYCSVHYHRHRANRFVVHSGVVNVTEWMGETSMVHRLTAGNVLDVPSLVVHQFSVLESGELTEEYWGDRVGSHPIKTSDIVRLSVGGMRTEKTITSREIPIPLDVKERIRENLWPKEPIDAIRDGLDTPAPLDNEWKNA